METKFDLKAYAGLVLNLKNRYHSQLHAEDPALYIERAKASLNLYSAAAEKAIIVQQEARQGRLQRNHAIAREFAPEETKQRVAVLASFKKAQDIRASRAHEAKAAVDAVENPTAQDQAAEENCKRDNSTDAKVVLSDDQAAAVLALVDITDLTALAEHIAEVVAVLERKPAKNILDARSLFDDLGACIDFPPRAAMKQALTYVSSLQTPAERKQTLSDLSKAQENCTEFKTYGTTFERLYALPPPQGWSTYDWKRLHELTGIDLETIPLNRATEHQAHLLVKARQYRSAMYDLHSGLYLPTPPANKETCFCGAENVNPTPFFVRVARGAPTGSKSKINGINGFDMRKHTGGSRGWAMFSFPANCTSTETRLAFIQAQLARTPELKDVHLWAALHGGAALWLSGSVDSLSANPATAALMVDLSCLD
jgi:hypothetical protein